MRPAGDAVAGPRAEIEQAGGGVWSRPAPPTGCETVRVTEACTACGACLATCPERALRRAPRRPLVVDSACTACWACIEICPAGAIVEVVRPSLRLVIGRPEVIA